MKGTTGKTSKARAVFTCIDHGHTFKGKLPPMHKKLPPCTKCGSRETWLLRLA